MIRELTLFAKGLEVYSFLLIVSHPALTLQLDDFIIYFAQFTRQPAVGYHLPSVAHLLAPAADVTAAHIVRYGMGSTSPSDLTYAAPFSCHINVEALTSLIWIEKGCDLRVFVHLSLADRSHACTYVLYGYDI